MVDTPIRPVVSALVVDCRNPSLVAAFWAALLGGQTKNFDDHGIVAVRAPGITFDFATVDESKTAKNRWHLDLATADHAAVIERAEALGARRAPDVGQSDRFTVMCDVEDNEFCVLHYPIDGPWVPPSAAVAMIEDTPAFTARSTPTKPVRRPT